MQAPLCPPFPKIIGSPDNEFGFKAFHPDQTGELWTLLVSDRHSPERKNSWPGISTLEQLAEYLKTCACEAPPPEENGFSIYFKKKLVGTFHWHSLSYENRRIELGYWIHFEFEGQGLISRAVQLKEGVLKKMGFHRVEIRCNSINRKACAVAERNGYRLEGTLRDNKIENGAYCDTAIYAKLLIP